ncbi:hypothetical protein KIW84_056752 [Lathyrus oleraceus]|uniref:CCAAT-binding factor domain-containing protein n=1 Tax=Pisum sativum TaxID=3888 RepID=A0A9D4X1F7_PEA|nr:hypothetical protein KIW84_056752 [Pisum sativum]
MYYTISHVPFLGKSNDTFVFEMWSVSESDHKVPSGDLDDKQLKSKNHKNNVLSADRIAKKMKLKFTKAWIAYLRLPLPLDVYKEVLINPHQAVLPHLSNPIMLCDFLTKSYDVGGVISVMALNSLYLLDSCLKSPLLPAYLAASFAKKLGRLLLSVPPSGALVITALVHNILRRHPSTNCLVHREDDDEDSNQRTDEAAASNLDNAETGSKPFQKSGIDYLNIEETDPMKSGAMRSSLWEIDTVRHHYCPPGPVSL